MGGMRRRADVQAMLLLLAGWAVMDADSNRRGRRPVLGSPSAHGAVHKVVRLGGGSAWSWLLVLCLFGRPGSGCRVLAVGTGSVAVVVVGAVVADYRSRTSAVPC